MKDKSRNILITLAVLLIVASGALVVYTLASSGNVASEPITLTYWTHVDEKRKVLEEQLIEEFELAHPGVSVKRMEYTATEMLGVISRSFQAGSAPDFFNFPAEGFSELLAAGYLAPVDYEAAGFSSADDLEATYLDGVLEALEKDGEFYGIPLELTSWCLYVNKRIFREAGLDPEKDYPRTWEQMVDISSRLVERDGSILLARGFDFRYPYYLAFFVPMVEQLGGSLVSDDGKNFVVGDDAWEKAFSFMAEWGPNGLNLGSPTYINARALFNHEEIAMCLSGLYQESRMETDNPSFFASDDWMVAPFPVFENAVRNVGTSPYVHFFAVNSSSSNEVQKLCWELIGLFAAHGEDYLRQIRLIVPRKDLLSSPLFEEMPYSAVFLSDMEKSDPIYSGPHAADIQSLIGETVENVMLRGEDPAKAVISLRAAIAELFSDRL